MKRHCWKGRPFVSSRMTFTSFTSLTKKPQNVVEVFSTTLSKVLYHDIHSKFVDTEIRGLRFLLNLAICKLIWKLVKLISTSVMENWNKRIRWYKYFCIVTERCFRYLCALAKCQSHISDVAYITNKTPTLYQKLGNFFKWKNSAWDHKILIWMPETSCSNKELFGQVG